MERQPRIELKLPATLHTLASPHTPQLHSREEILAIQLAELEMDRRDLARAQEPERWDGMS